MMSYLTPLFWDAGFVELRHDRGQGISPRWQSAWFRNPETLQQNAMRLLDSGNLYTSLHRPRFTEIIDGGPGDPIQNHDVTRYTRLFFDFDPVRPSNTAATDEQVAHAREHAKNLRDILRKLGWPDPLIAKSGNGYHLQYRVALPNTDEWRETLKQVYRGMAQEFSCEAVGFDPTVRNPGRICCLYGSIKRKAPDTSLHRQSKCWVPDKWRQVTQRQVEEVANFYAKQPQPVHTPRQPAGKYTMGAGDYRSLDVIAWFTSHGLYEHHVEDHIHAVQCPWESEHTESNPNDTVIFEAHGDSWPGFFCHHSHCDVRTIRDVMALWGDADAFCTREFGGAL